MPLYLKSVRVWQFNEFVSIKIPSQYLLTFLPNEIYRIIASTRARPSGVPSRRPPELSCPKYIGWFFPEGPSCTLVHNSA